MNRSPNRTVLFLMYLGALELAAVALLRGHGPDAATMLSSVTFCLVGLGTVQAGKSLGQYAADGTGLKGIAKALLTDAKPGEPAPEVKP